MTSKLPNNLDAWFMPFTANRQFKDNPRLLASAKGVHYTTTDGRQIIDGTAGMWCVNAGHGRPEIVEAVQAQAAELDYAPPFQMGHPPAFALAEKTAVIMPEGLDHVFFTNSGSESVDTALKIALAYHRAKGEGGRRRLVGRARGYHGVGFGGMSVGGIANNRLAFGSLLPEIDHLSHTHNLGENAYSKGQPEWGAHLADELEGLVGLHGAKSLAAVIVEPMAGSTGVLVPPKGYLERLRQICDTHGILLIFDEVITGFGRLGAATAAEHLSITPDMITMAKGLTNAAVPMGAVILSKDIHDGLMTGPEQVIELFHGYTYSGHPLACAAGLATLDIYAKEDLFARAAGLASYWEDAVHALKGLPHVIDLRNIGLVGAVELEGRVGKPGSRAYDVFVRCFEQGALVRLTGDIIALSPPLVIEKDEIDQLFQVLSDALKWVD